MKKDENILTASLQLEGGKIRDTGDVSMEERYSFAGFIDVREPQTKE